MSEYTWQDFLSLGVEELDAQHRRLIGIVNDFLDAVHAGHGDEAVRRASQALLDHANEHFEAEEAYMESIDYPDLQAHRDEHRALLLKASRMMERLTTQAARSTDVQDMDVLLKTWLLDHILNTDLKIAEFTASGDS